MFSSESPCFAGRALHNELVARFYASSDNTNDSIWKQAVDVLFVICVVVGMGDDHRSLDCVCYGG